MRFKAKKKYGQSKISYCPFCNSIATQKNEQGLEVCHRHAKNSMGEFKCSCGSWLEIRSGKFGPYFKCLNCGIINYKKGIEMRSLPLHQRDSSVPSKIIIEKNMGMNIQKDIPITKEKKKEITISSRDVEYFN